VNKVQATPLLVAALHGQVEAVRALAARGARVDACTVKGASAMHHAAAWGHLQVHGPLRCRATWLQVGATCFLIGGGLLQVVEALVELGADPDATTPLGRSTVDWAGYRRASLLD